VREERSRLSRSASVAQPIDYMLKRWDRFARFAFARYPRPTSSEYAIEASGRCPPEDIGGPWGYAEFLEAIANPKARTPR
jgi:hypothetical protein